MLLCYDSVDFHICLLLRSVITASKMAKCQKQKISGYISVVLFIVATAKVTKAEDILDPDLAEGLVALQPVLKDHNIEYSDPNSVRTKYNSNAKFNPRGMHHVYAITHTFLDLIQRTNVLPDSLNATAVLATPPRKLPSLLKDHWEELLLQYIGVVTVSICGVLLALLIPLAGFCLCCCRCAGKYHTAASSGI